MVMLVFVASESFRFLTIRFKFASDAKVKH